MKYIPEKYEDIARLVKWLNNGELTAEEYFQAVNEYSKILVELEARYPGRV